MTCRELVTPSRSLRSERAVFKLQPPPQGRNKANRKCSIITGVQSDQTNNMKPILVTSAGSSSLSKPRRASNDGLFTIENDSMPSIFEDDDTATVCSFKTGHDDTNVHPADRHNWRQRSIQTITIDGSTQRGVLVASPLMSGNRMCNSPLPIGSTEKDTDERRTPKSSTSSYFNLARTSFGASLKKRTSQPTSSASVRKATKSSAAPHTVVCLSPRSPLTPGSLFSLQSPKGKHIDDAGTFMVFTTGHDVEAGPLSATLKSLGVSRDGVDKVGDGGEKSDKVGNRKSAPMEAFETRLARRVFLHERAQYASEENRQRAQEAESLFHTRQHAPSSIVKADHLSVSDLGISTYPPQVGGRVQSTIRGGQQRSALQASFIRLSTLFSGYKIPLRQGQKQDEKPLVEKEATTASVLSRPEPVISKLKGDGWGGLLPRQSWFAYNSLGPLASPCGSPTKPKQMRPHVLQASHPSKLKEEDIWVDEVDAVVGHSPMIEAEDRTLPKLRVRFPDYTPKSSRIAAEMSKEAKAYEEAIAVTYTDKSAEGRPVIANGVKQFFEVHYGMLVSILVVLAIAIAILIIALSAVKSHHSA